MLFLRRTRGRGPFIRYFNLSELEPLLRVPRHRFSEPLCVGRVCSVFGIRAARRICFGGVFLAFLVPLILLCCAVAFAQKTLPPENGPATNEHTPTSKAKSILCWCRLSYGMRWTPCRQSDKGRFPTVRQREASDDYQLFGSEAHPRHFGRQDDHRDANGRFRRWRFCCRK